MPSTAFPNDDFAPRVFNEPDRTYVALLTRIATALELANERTEPAYEINRLQLRALEQQLNGGIVPATIISGSTNGPKRR